MKKLSPLDLSFLLMENSSSQMHMACYLTLKIPERQKNSFVPTLLQAYRSGEVASPFNYRLKWLDKSVASWEEVEPDLSYHVRHIALPRPGNIQQFYELVAVLNAPLLDRNKPLWECYVIEGLEKNQCAVLIKMHHALLDGAAGLKMFRSSMNDNARDKSIRAMWGPIQEKPAKRPRVSSSRLEILTDRLSALPRGLRGLTTELTDMGAQALNIRPGTTRRPFGAKRTRLNNSPCSSERRYANLELPLARVKAVSKATGKTVNDVLMTVIDDALHHYLAEHGAPAGTPLVAMMPISMRTPGDESASNQAVAALVEMGQTDASPAQRLAQIHESTLKTKHRNQKLPPALRELYSLVTLGSGNLLELSTSLQSMPSFNLVISNMIGPREQLYVGGAPLANFSGLPIVPPGGGLNVTFATIHNTINMAAGAAPEAIENPFQLTDRMLQSFAKLEQVSVPRRKKRTGIKPGKVVTKSRSPR